MRESVHAKRNRANRSLLSGKRFDTTEDHDQRLPEYTGEPLPRSCIRNQSREISLKRRLSSWHCLAISAASEQHSSRLVPVYQSNQIERVIRSDAGVAHRLPLSARVLSIATRQVKAEPPHQRHFWAFHASGPVSTGFNRNGRAPTAGSRSKQRSFERGQPLHVVRFFRSQFALEKNIKLLF